jgi:peroxiredoxin Q/BCP
MKKLIIVVIVMVGILFLNFNMKNRAINKIKIGDKLPSFTLVDQNGNDVVVNNLLGKPMVIYFYPKDDTRVV